MNPCSLAMTAGLHDKIRRHLFPGDGLESAAIILCALGTGKDYLRLIAHEIIALPQEKSKRTASFLSWPFAEHFPPDRITDIEKRGLSVVTIHSHPNGFDNFSRTDDINDRVLFPSIYGWFDDNRPHGAAIMMPDGKIRARVVNAAGKFAEMISVSVVGENIQTWKKSKKNKKSDGSDKLAQTFGSGTIKLLQSLRAGVVGCSGTGSIIIELLARNGIGEIVAIDNDAMEPKNINRIVNSTMADARKGRLKTEIACNAVKKMRTGARVYAYPELTDSPKAVAALIDCDILFGCVDSAFGRYHLECIASAYCIPYFDVGVSLDADGKGGIEAADAASHYIHPEGKGLLARGGYNMDQVTAENHKRLSPDYYEEQKIAGYLAAVGEEQPAVMSVNMQAACMAFNDFLARVHPYRMDNNREFARQRFRIVHGHYENSEFEPVAHPLFAKYMCTGDRSILVKNNLRRKS